MALSPIGPGGVRQWHQLQLLALERPADRLAQQLRPKRLGRAVVEQHVAVVEQARDAERCALACHPCAEGHARAAQRAIGDGDEFAAEAVVDDLMPVEDANGVGAHHAAACQAEHAVLADQTRLHCADEARAVDGRDAVARRPAARDRRGRHQGVRQIETVERLRDAGPGQPQAEQHQHAGQCKSLSAHATAPSMSPYTARTGAAGARPW